MTPLVVYLHGFRSSPQSAKARALVHAVAALPAASRVALVVPDLGHQPAAAIGSVLDIVAREHRHGAPLTFVGSSLGGFYATHLAERLGARAALINPAVRPWEDLEPWLGTQTNLYTGESFEVTDGHFDELRALAVSNLTQPDRYLLLVQTGDEVLDYRQAIAFYAGARQYVQGGGDHAFQDFGAQIPAILRFATDGEPG
ncbi:MAG TPA: YqiA/YcfP family alpha/beta fold hydrolase [Casimicrobiaceae bacterium]